MLGGGQVHRPSGKRVRFGLQHSALGYVSPCEFEAAYYANQRKVAA